MGWLRLVALLYTSRHPQNYPLPVMSGSDAQSRKPHGVLLTRPADHFVGVNVRLWPAAAIPRIE